MLAGGLPCNAPPRGRDAATGSTATSKLEACGTAASWIAAAIALRLHACTAAVGSSLVRGRLGLMTMLLPTSHVWLPSGAPFEGLRLITSSSAGRGRALAGLVGLKVNTLGLAHLTAKVLDGLALGAPHTPCPCGHTCGTYGTYGTYAVRHLRHLWHLWSGGNGGREGAAFSTLANKVRSTCAIKTCTLYNVVQRRHVLTSRTAQAALGGNEALPRGWL